MNSILVEKRIKNLNNKNAIKNNGPVVYWISREQRVYDNYALFAASQKAQEAKTTLMVVFCLQKSFLGANHKIFDFMMEGLMQVEKDLNDLNIPFVILRGNPVEEIPKFVTFTNTSTLYTDFSPLKIGIKWHKDVVEKIDIPFYEVDTHNIVPVWEVSNKREFSARTLRPKIHKLLDKYLIDMPKMKRWAQQIDTDVMLRQAQHDKNIDFSIMGVKGIDWKKTYTHCCHPGVALDKTIGSHNSNYFIGGRLEAEKNLRGFVDNKLSKYSTLKNDPNEDVLSNLSPYLHFGQISAQRVALTVLKASGFDNNFWSLWLSPESDQKLDSVADSDLARVTIQSFLEELIVRRELAENFCYHTQNYDTFDAFPAWAKETLNKHRKDKREFLYTKEVFENAETHDALWNVAQKQMVMSGKMHGYMRMYWAKKILEWTEEPEDALEIAIYLNDKYSLDGRDPNGYTGIAWSIGGLHDRPWFERPIFGLVRYMNASGAEKKFDVKKYISRWSCK